MGCEAILFFTYLLVLLEKVKRSENLPDGSQVPHKAGELPEGVSLPAGRQGFINVHYGVIPALSADRQAQIYPDLSGPPVLILFF